MQSLPLYDELGLGVEGDDDTYGGGKVLRIHLLVLSQSVENYQFVVKCKSETNCWTEKLNK